MSNQLFERPHRRHIKDLNIVPILDMLTTIIFFLLLSTSFMEFNKVTLPPARTSTITDPVRPQPVQVKIAYIQKSNVDFEILMHWTGAQAGTAKEALHLTEAATKENSALLYAAARKLAEDFSKKYPGEKTLQIGMGKNLPYRDLITIMDAVRPKLPDIVLYSYNEAEAVAGKIGETSL